MRVGTALENWRISEKRLSLIESRIAELTGRRKLSAAESLALPLLQRAREAAKQSADKYWALLVLDVSHGAGSPPTATDGASAGMDNSGHASPTVEAHAPFSAAGGLLEDHRS